MKSVVLQKSGTNEKKDFEHLPNKENNNFVFTINSNYFNEDYVPSSNTGATTNFANLARGVNRQENLRNTIEMINTRFNSLAKWDNPNDDRYSVALEIISVDIDIDGSGTTFPSIEILKNPFL